MKNKLFTLAPALTLAAVIGSIYAVPALAAVIKAALVKNVDEPGRSPFQAWNLNGLACPSVQPGQRLVVEHISGTFTTDGTLVDLRFILGTTKFSLPIQNQGAANNLTTYHYGGPIKAYLDAGESCSTQSAGVNGQATIITNTVSGYMVDLNN